MLVKFHFDILSNWW